MPSTNTTPERAIYPTAQGYSYGTWSQMASLRVNGTGIPGGAGASARGGGVGGPGGQAPAAGPVGAPTSAGGAQSPFSGNPLVALLGIIILVAAAWLLAHKTGNAGEFSNIRLSALNIFLIAFVAIVGIVSLKFLAAKAAGTPLGTGWAQLVLAT